MALTVVPVTLIVCFALVCVAAGQDIHGTSFAELMQLKHTCSADSVARRVGGEGLVLLQTRSLHHSGVLISEEEGAKRVFPMLRDPEGTWEANYVNDAAPLGQNAAGVAQQLKQATTAQPIGSPVGTAAQAGEKARISPTSPAASGGQAAGRGGEGPQAGTIAAPPASPAPPAPTNGAQPQRAISDPDQDWAWNPEWGTRAEGQVGTVAASSPEVDHAMATNDAAEVQQVQAPAAYSDSLTGLPGTGVAKETSACVTREDPRVADSTFYITLPAGTPCVFGVDALDEGYHCIMEGGVYGSFGWCFTSKDKSSWGSCDRGCPLFGPDEILEAGMDSIRDDIKEILAREHVIENSTEAIANATDIIANSQEVLANSTQLSNTTTDADIGVEGVTQA